MQKEFSLSDGKAMINFTAKYCDTAEKLFDSYGFKKVLNSYFKRIKTKKININMYITESLNTENPEEKYDALIELFKLLLVLRQDKVSEISSKYKNLLENKEMFILFIEDLYSFWRKLERYTIVQNSKIGEGFQNVSFVDANNQFSMLILNTYRKVEENVLGVKPKVYRQLPAGGNAGLILNNVKWNNGEVYASLKDIPFIDAIVLDPPFITYPKQNTRDGLFLECYANPLENAKINSDHFFCYPAKVGNLLAFIYFHRDFMAHGVTLCNLFEMATEEEYKNNKPDIIFAFGVRDESKEVKTIFYEDKENQIMVGYINYNDNIDYFGYMKKMTLTLHNIIMINRGYLPIHGAGVNIVTKDNKTANVVILGDSGAGKSETIEALRELGEDYISEMTIIFDDMGVIKMNSNGKPLAFGTEIGAFVRLDDLDTGYAFRQIDRSIFMNPDRINARLVIPVSTYSEIIKGYEVDFLFYANNYENGEEIEYFEDAEAAIKIFKTGARMAKGTTTEKGLVETYFANPFGPVQKMKETDKLISKFFNEFINKGIKLGEIRTKLGINDMEKQGPRAAALSLLNQLKK